MNPEITALASTFSSAVVSAMATDAWQDVRIRVAEIWQRFQPSRADMAERLLEANRSQLIRLQGDSRSQFERLLIDQWHLEAIALMQLNSAAREALIELLRSPQSNQSGVRQTARAHDNSRIFMAGRDQNFSGNE